MYPEIRPTSRGRRLVGDTGQATIVLLLVLAVALGTVFVLAQLGAVAADRARARTAADAAALAGAVDGEAGAGVMAHRNGGEVESFRLIDGITEVTVRVGRARATSRARIGVRPTGGSLVPVPTG